MFTSFHRQLLCLQTKKSIYDLTRLARQVRTQNEGLLEKDMFFTRELLF